MRAQRSGFIKIPPAQLEQQPRLCQPPVASDCFRRNLESLGYLRLGQSAEEAEFNDASLALVNSGQSGERLVERDQILVARLADHHRIIQRNLLSAAAAFLVAV